MVWGFLVLWVWYTLYMADNLINRAVPQVGPVGNGNLNVPASKLPVYDEPNDFRQSLHWRVFRIIAEFIDGWQFFADFKKTITFFGSARFQPGDKWYEDA